MSKLTMTKFNEQEEEILDKYYPPRTGICEEYYAKDEWNWTGGEHDELIPWQFGDEINEEQFLVLYHGWNGTFNTMHFTSVDRLPYREDSIHESYDTIIMYRDKIWQIAINENMAIHALVVLQELPKHFRISEVEMKVVGEYWDGNSVQDLSTFRAEYEPAEE